jgi:apolipoprotein D and lipocalin family protein
MTTTLRFFKLSRGDLWVIGLDPNYRWALTGTPSRRRLWLIARDRCIDPADYAQAMDIAAARGFDAARVKSTEHNELDPVAQRVIARRPCK